MDRRLIRCGAVCRLDRSAPTIVSEAQKCSRNRSKNVVVSGFPTALKATTSAVITNASTLPSDRKEGQLLLRCDYIPPPPPVVVDSRRLPPPPGPDIWFLYPSSSITGAVWEGRTEFFLGGIRKSIVREDRSGVMCDQRRVKSGKKPAAGLNHFLPILRKPRM